MLVQISAWCALQLFLIVTHVAVILSAPNARWDSYSTIMPVQLVIQGIIQIQELV
jgi:hypothetical protein